MTDLVMPDLDGFGVLSHALEARPCTPILLVTGKNDVQLAEEAFRQGARLTSSRSRWTATGCYGQLIWLSTHRLRRRIEERRVYLTQLREVMNRRWETPLSKQPTRAV